MFDGMIYDVQLYNRALTARRSQSCTGWIGDWQLVETSGTTAADSSLVNLDGTYQNGVSLAASSPVSRLRCGGGRLRRQQRLRFDRQRIRTTTLRGPSPLPLWIKVTSFTKTWQAIFTKGDSAWRFSRNNTGNTIHFACTGLSQFQVNGVVNVNDGVWHHIAGVYDGNSLDLYVDGVLDASVASTGSISTNDYNVEIGRNGQASGREFHGAIYDPRIYSRMLCPAEIQDLYNGRRTKA